ncbi:hypothetical protein Aduo_006538 [Ancylostoma duodenale]
MEWLIRYGWDAEKIPGYGCEHTPEEAGRKDYVMGICFIVYGIVTEFIYMIDMIVMVKKQHRRLSCYKIMIVLGIYDMAAISFNSLLTGYYWLNGINYCTNPTSMYIFGSVAVSLWCGACLNCFVLVINRLLDVSNKAWMYMLFKNQRTYVVLLLPLFYTLYFCFFTPPILFNSNHMAWFFFTFAGRRNPEEYYNYPHTVNNLSVVVVTCLLYVQYSRVFLRLSKVRGGLSWAQKSFFIQCSSICTANLIAALIYVYMQFFDTPFYFVLIGHMCWQLGHGFPAIVYLLLNRTIQREVLVLLRIRKPLTINHVNQTSSRTNVTS